MNLESVIETIDVDEYIEIRGAVSYQGLCGSYDISSVSKESKERSVSIYTSDGHIVVYVF